MAKLLVDKVANWGVLKFLRGKFAHLKVAYWQVLKWQICEFFKVAYLGVYKMWQIWQVLSFEVLSLQSFHICEFIKWRSSDVESGKVCSL